MSGLGIQVWAIKQTGSRAAPSEPQLLHRLIVESPARQIWLSEKTHTHVLAKLGLGEIIVWAIENGAEVTTPTAPAVLFLFGSCFCRTMGSCCSLNCRQTSRVDVLVFSVIQSYDSVHLCCCVGSTFLTLQLARFLIHSFWARLLAADWRWCRWRGIHQRERSSNGTTMAGG